MKPYRLLYYALFSILLSCTSKPEDKVADPAVTSKTAVKRTTNVSGTAYFFGRDFIKETCEAESACDCCSMFLLFIDDESFITIYPCESEETLLRGTYKILDNNNVVLNYDTLQVDRDYNFELEGDTLQSDKPEYIVSLKKAKITNEILQSSYCNGKLYFKVKDDDGVMYGTVDAQYSLTERIQQLKDEGVWDEIQQ